MATLELVEADITTLAVDTIVNAANNSLLGGGGVDGAIHRAAGVGLLAECRKLGGCDTADAKVTDAYNLPCRYVIHTVGPVWQGGGQNEAQLLARCYERSLELADELQLESIAFPAISCGAYAFPLSAACEIAVKTVKAYFSSHHSSIARVVFTTMNHQLTSMYKKVLTDS